MQSPPPPDGARTGIALVLSSPSGAGKSSLTRQLLTDDPKFLLSISATTRSPRPGEIDGRDYWFVDRAEFEARVRRGDMLEHAEVFGNFYGSPRAAVEYALQSGRDIVFDVDWQGALQLRASAIRDAVVAIFILPPSIAALESRLRTRAQDSEATIRRRMDGAAEEIRHWDSYDYVLINDDFAACYSRIGTIVAAERLKRGRQPGLGAHVARLIAEFEERV